MMNKSDYRRVAELHIQGIPFGFLSSMGVSFLAALYRAVDMHADSVLFVARNDSGEVAGFLSGTISVKRFYKYALSRHCMNLALPVLFKLFSIATIKRIFETLLYPFKKHESEASAVSTEEAIDCELLSVALDASLHGRGIGKKLVADFELFLRNKDISGEYKVVTSAEDPKSNGFYKSAGFKLHHEFTHHGKKMNEYHKPIV
ncbi:MAG: GNAT family N-acetyltransferase [Fibrobacteres bacterium]|nr:GNAT family N-acetyltransferase [Fibrobacterota bacterium]